MIKVVALAFLFALSGCAVGPLTAHETGRSVGRDKNEFVGALGNTGYVFKWSHGLNEQLDLGLQLETLSLGIRGKYAFINNQDHGWSLAGLAGYGVTAGGNYVNADLTASYLFGIMEPFAALRYAHVHSDPNDVRDKDTGDILFTLNLPDYDYGQFFLGTRVWFNPNLFLSVEASQLTSLTHGLEFKDAVLAGLGLGCRF